VNEERDEYEPDKYQAQQTCRARIRRALHLRIRGADMETGPERHQSDWPRQRHSPVPYQRSIRRMNTLRQSMSWMHTWTGLLLGWVLFFMFLTGSAAYYDTEIDRWMQPEQPPMVKIEDPVALFQMALDHATAGAPEADSYFIRIPTSRSYSPYVTARMTSTSPDGKRSFEDLAFLADGSIVPEGRDTGGGQALYQMHWAFHYIPRSLGEIFAGFAAFFMLAAIISGIITHKKIIADFFTLRFGKGQRSWLDSHNVISVMSLPYQIMITFSGLIFVASTFFIPIFLAQYGVSGNVVQTVSEEVFGIRETIERTGEAVALTDIAPVIAEAQTILGDEPVTRLNIKNPGDATAIIEVQGSFAGAVLREIPVMEFNGVTGERLIYDPRKFEGSMTVMNTFEGLHEALFAGPILRIVFFVSGLMGGGMIATGLVLWTKKRRQKLKADEKAERNLIIIERMNVGVIAGLSIAIASYFWANRFLPVDMANRAEWEMHALFLVWLAAIVHGLARPPQRGWIEQLSFAALIFITTPIMNALTSSIHLGNTLPLPGRPGDMALAGVDLWMLTIGIGFAYAARISMTKQEHPKERKKAANELAPVPAE
ncbi:MAG: PepSY-associated TM helix domain-containing protein, partial [Pseudomonadota bacterium]